MIKLPSYEWFMGQLKYRGKGNVFSGSYGCDPLLGGISDDQLRFRVWIDKNDEDDWILISVYYKGKNCFEVTAEEDMTKAVFEATSDGIVNAEIWINNAISDYKNTEVHKNE